ncbi:MAG TPA: hypothetical protein VFS37_13740 [Conexibacter sp.]|nr:hypothetical protein [Conexibacter sp.]
MKGCKLLLATTVATALFAGLVGVASARNLSSTSQTWRATWGVLIFQGAIGEIDCEISLEGTFHARTIAKVLGSLIGYVTRAEVARCAEGRMTILRETLPWHVPYTGFSGTLPSITVIRTSIIGLSLRIQEPLAACLVRGTPENPVNFAFNRNTATGVLDTAEISGTVPTSCGVNGTFSSSRAPVTVLSSSTRITVLLI